MLLRQYTRGQSICRVIRQNWHHGLRQYRAVVEFGGHLVHGGTCKSAASVNRALVGMQSRKRG